MLAFNSLSFVSRSLDKEAHTPHFYTAPAFFFHPGEEAKGSVVAVKIIDGYTQVLLIYVHFTPKRAHVLE
jgi:hypothetical protein